jgi:hypothetical protein
MADMGDMPKFSEPRLSCDVVPSSLMIPLATKYGSWTCGGVIMPEIAKVDELLVLVTFSSICAGGRATSSASFSLRLFFGRPICFWGEKTHSSFSL